MSTVQANRGVLDRWYHEMWGKTDFDRIPEFAAPTYLRHDVTGASNHMPATAYRDMLKPVLGHLAVQEFDYFLVCEGDYVGALGRYVLEGGRHWDWVQLFRIEGGALAETWLTGMGGTDAMGYPHPRNAWNGGEIPSAIGGSANKRQVEAWYRALASGGDAAACLAPRVRVHDIAGADVELDARAYVDRVRAQMGGDTAGDLQLFMIEEHDVVFAVGRWQLGGERHWEWVQAFELAEGKICRTWLPAIGGTDASLRHSPEHKWTPGVMPGASVQVAP